MVGAFIMPLLVLVNAIMEEFGLDNIVLFVPTARILILLWENVNVILLPIGMASLVYHVLVTQYGILLHSLACALKDQIGMELHV